jgi:hypothetical protein
MGIATTLTGNLTTPYAARRIGNVAHDAYERLADNELLPYLRRELPGHYKEKVKKKITGQGLNTQLVIFSNEKGVKQIEEGRPAGKKAPPFKAINKWVQKHNLGARAVSPKTRKSLSAGIRRSFDRKAGKLRTRTQSRQAMEKSITIAIQRNIAKEGLPRRTGFKPSHALFLFRDMKQNNAAAVNASNVAMQDGIARILNA